jgi:DNA polymerase bacteriophage-type
VITASVDFECFSAADLIGQGAYVYAQHPSTDILCMAIAFGDGEPWLWKPGHEVPEWLFEHVLLGRPMLAWNAAFERLVWRHVGVRKYGFPAVADDQWWCTAAQGANMALPRSLDDAAAAIGGAAQKDLNGRRIMLQVSQPRRPSKANPLTRWTPEMAPEKFQALYAYCQQDVRAERGIASRLYALSPWERQLYLLDQQINDRGVRIDRPLIQAAQRVVEQTLGEMDARLAGVTRGAVEAHTQTARLVQWLNAQGVACDSVAAGAVEDMLARPGLPYAAGEALRIRQEAAKSSTGKLDAMLRAAGPDDRIRGSLLYCGAARTRRWSGRLHQPQNFPRGDETVLADVDGAVAALATGNAGLVRALYGNPMDVVASLLRPMMVAAPGHRLMACDFANIEGRVLAWMAGEDWKLDAFRAYDAGTGPDLYKVAYAKSFGVSVGSVTKAQRQIGKVQELSGGYQGWIGACRAFASLYGFSLPDEEYAKWMGEWRNGHPRTVRLWRDLDEAAIKAVARPGVKFEAGPVTYLCANDFLWCRLPSGGVLAYARPTIERNDRGQAAVHFWTVPNPTKPFVEGTRRWAKVSGYGGLWCENIDQAISRDLLACAMQRLDAAGYPLVLTVHDELLSEVPDGSGSLFEMTELAASVPAWAAGLPVSAEGWVGQRYRK